MDYDIDDIPIQIEGVTLPSPAIPSTSIDNYQSDTNSEYASDESDDDESCCREKEKKAFIRRENSKLSTHLKGLMGEANLRYARGDLETAKKMCFEVMRQSPEAYEPYLTLSQMYETTNVRKYKGYLMLASHLAPGNTSIWCRLAEVYLQEGNSIEAVRCYSKAVKYDIKNIWLHRKRIELLEQRGDRKMILMCKQTLANNLPKKNHETILNIVMEVAKEHFKNKNYIRAIEVLKIPLKRIPKQVTKDIINMILELLLINERYSECLDIFTHFCGFSFDVTVTSCEDIVVNSYICPENLQVDLKMKFIACLVRLRSDNLVSMLINDILIEDDVEVVGDLYLDVVDALMQSCYPQEAMKLLVPLVKSKNYSLAGVWLKYAECLTSCQMPDQAIEAYFTVMALAPSHVEVLYPLAMLLLQQNKKKEALEVLSQDLSSNKLDVAVLLEQIKLLKQINDWDNYWKSVELLLSRHCTILKNPEELRIVLMMGTRKEKMDRIKKMRNFRRDSSEVEVTFTSIREPTLEDEYKYYKEILQLAKDRKEYTLFQKFAFMGMCSKKFSKYFDEINLIAFFACVYNNDPYHGYAIIRELLIRHSSNKLCWNWFSLIIQTPDDIRHTRFLDRYQARFSQSTSGIIAANYDISVANYVPALNYFMKEFKTTKSSYSTLMLGIIMLHMYGQRNMERTKKKIIAETVTYLFLNYAKSRYTYAEQETCYNLGRMYHQLGIMYLAEFYYKKVFKVQNGLLEKYPDVLCLKREAAFNLHLIYKNNGNVIAARNVLMEHIVI